jgi:hypothetical protein
MKQVNRNRIYFRLLLLFWMLEAIVPFKAQAQRNKERLQSLIEEDRTTIDAVAGYDENIQQDILKLAQTPEVLNILDDLQKKSEKQFRNIIQEYDRDGQAAMYEMARYPDLISELVRNGKPSSSDVNRIITNYPSDIRETAKKYSRSYYNALVEIDQLNNEIDRQFQSYLNSYDDQTHASVRILLKYPEIVSILVEDKEFTRLLGLAFQEDPDWVKNKLNSISEELEQENQKELADYKNQVQNDPEAYQEMLNAGEKFAEESNIGRENEEDYPRGGSLQINIIKSYPYWFGYPYWYPYPYWRPYPVYYHTGFYIGPNRNIVFIGLPSYHFIYWQTHYHPALYPHLSYNYYNYYHNHYLPYRNVRNRPVAHYGFYRSVERNVINNPRVNNDNLIRIDRRRGSNIVKQPGNNEFYSGRRTSTDINNGIDHKGSLKRGTFPRTTPSTVKPSEGPYRSRNYSPDNNSPRKYTAPVFERKSTDIPPSSQGEKRLNSNPGEGKKSTFQQRTNTEDNSFRNYRNYRATEQRQVNPSLGKREPIQKMSPNSGRRNQSDPQPNKTSERFRKSREK